MCWESLYCRKRTYTQIGNYAGWCTVCGVSIVMSMVVGYRYMTTDVARKASLSSFLDVPFLVLAFLVFIIVFHLANPPFEVAR